MNDEITALEAREITMKSLAGQRTAYTDHIEACVCGEIAEQAKKGFYFAEFHPSEHARHNKFSTAAVGSAFYRYVRPRLEARGFVVTRPTSEVLYDACDDFFIISWDK